MVRKIANFFKPEKNKIKNRKKQFRFCFKNLNKTSIFVVLEPFNSKVQI